MAKRKSTRSTAAGKQEPTAAKRQKDDTSPAMPTSGTGRVRDNQVEAAPVQWLWPGWMAVGEVSLIAGPSSVGKSTMLAALAASVAGGGIVPGVRGERPRTTLWYTAEEQIDIQLGARLRAAGSPPGWVCYPGHRADGVLFERLCLPPHSRHLGDVIHEEDAVLVVIDPITSFLASDCSPFDASAVRALIEGLVGVARSSHSHICFTLHDRKSTEGPSISHVSGSAAWTQTPRTVIRLAPDAALSGRYLLCAEKGQVAGRPESHYYHLPRVEGVPRFEIGPACPYGPDDIDDSPTGMVERTALEEAKEFLRAGLGFEPRKASTLQLLAQGEGISWITVRRAATLIGVVKTRIPHESTWYSEWSQPTGGWPK